MKGIPKILNDNPQPRITQKSFHGKKIPVVEGYVDPNKIKGWVENARLALEVKVFKERNAGREPDDDEIFDIMISNQDFKIKQLSEDIRINGIRRPIIIANDGRLLDGNRRYFSAKYLLKTARTDEEKDNYKAVPVWVLTEDATANDERRIIVEENFSPSFKIEWDYYVKATHIYQDKEMDDSIQGIAKRYKWSTAKVREAIEIMNIIQEFLLFAQTDKPDGLGLNPLEAECRAAELYQMFNEAQKSLKKKLENDPDFKEQIFRWLYDGKFKSFVELRCAGDAQKIPEAWEMLHSDDPQAGKKAKTIVDSEKLMGGGSAEKKIENFAGFLGKLKAEEIAAMSPQLIESLQEILGKVLKMAQSVKEDWPTLSD